MPPARIRRTVARTNERLVMTALIVLVALLVPLFFLLVYVVSSFNKLVGLRNRMATACPPARCVRDQAAVR